MLVLGLQGSPRRKGNTAHLMSMVMAQAETLGARTHVIDVEKAHILPCKEYIVCEKKGFCPIDDDMKAEVYTLLREADVVVPGSPIFFYNVTAQLKALIDRSQTLWARKYRLKLTDPKRRFRQGIALSVGATRGKQLFDGVHLTMKYFFDAVGADYSARLYYREVEHPGDMANHPTVHEDVNRVVSEVIAPLAARQRVLFAGNRDACRTQLAAAFTRIHAGDRIDVESGGSAPAERIEPLVAKVMAEKGIDMGFLRPRTMPAQPVDRVIRFEDAAEAPDADGTAEIWPFHCPENPTIEAIRDLRDAIESRVRDWLDAIS